MRSVLRHVGAASVLALSLGFCAAGAQASTPPVPVTAAPATPSVAAVNPNTAIAIMQATAAMQAGNCKEAMPALTQLWDDADLQKSDPDMAEQFRFSRVLCTFQLEDVKAALALSEQNIRHVGATLSSFDLHVFLLLTDGQNDAAGLTLEEAMTRFPADAPNLTDITVMATMLTQSTEDKRRALLAHLERVHWQLHDASGRQLIDYLRLDGLRVAVKAGDKPLAELYRADIANNAYMYALSQGDGDISDPAVPSMQVVPIVRKQIEDVKTHIANTPTDLLGMRYLVEIERSADEHELALLQLNGILQLIRENGLDKFDAPNTYPNLAMDRAVLMADIGKLDDALATYKEGAEKMRGPGTLNFILSYMQFLIDAGRENDALALESHVDFAGMDADDKRALATVEACAYGYMKDTLRFSLAMRAAATPGGIVDPKPFLCAGDTEGAAQALIEQINDPASRDDMIMAMQDSKPAIPHSERGRAYVNAWTALKKRPDVVAAAKARNIVIRSWLLRY